LLQNMTTKWNLKNSKPLTEHGITCTANELRTKIHSAIFHREAIALPLCESY